MKKPHFNVCITCVGGRLIYDMINAIRDSDDYTITVIGIDVNPDAHGRLLCDYFRVFPLASSDPDGWLWTRIIAAAPRSSPLRMTSRV